MLSIHITLPQVINMLRVLAEREPDRIGKSETGGCVYAMVENNALVPVCIIGQMFADLGLLRLLLSDPNDLDQLNGGNLSACAVGYGFWDTLARFGVTVDEDAQAFAHAVQRRQDDNDTWAEAFAVAVQQYRDKEQDALNQRLDGLFG